MKRQAFPNASPPCYAATYCRLQKVAQKLGYALAVHGSMTADLDLIAVPWTNKACGARTLMIAIMREARGYIATMDKMVRKPHGRVAWAIQLGAGPYIDLSVTPRKSL